MEAVGRCGPRRRTTERELHMFKLTLITAAAQQA